MFCFVFYFSGIIESIIFLQLLICYYVINKINKKNNTLIKKLMYKKSQRTSINE